MRFLLVADLVDRAVRNGNNVEVAIRPLLNRWSGPESGSDQERFAFVGAELRQVVGDTIGEPRVGNIDLHPVTGQRDAEQAAAGAPDL